MSYRETTLLDSLNCRHPCHEKRFTSTGSIIDVSDTTKESSIESAEGIDTEGLSPAVLASAGSVALALYFYYVRGDKQRGQFVGFWPVTILAMASYFKLEEIKQMLAGDDE
jgi:hypothetical protein